MGVENSGLEPIFEAVFSLPPLEEGAPNVAPTPASEATRLANLEVFQPQALMATSQQLDDSLPSALMDAIDYLRKLRSPSMVREVTEAAAEKFCADFEMLEEGLATVDEALDNMQNGEQEEEEKPRLRDLFPRTS